MSGLEIAADLLLPAEAVTQTFAILAKRGSGKTYTGAVMAEEMLAHHLQVIVIDPVGVWWGLRSSADGKGEGLPIVIAGGEHADIPINPDAGETLAEAIVENRLSIVIDLSLFRKNEQVKFMTDFAETLYRKNREAVHLILDEADAFAPQRPMPNEARMLGAMEDIVRRGRARGIGVTMITQRPSVLNKNVLTQIEVLVALRLTAPLDQKAVDEWVKAHAEKGQREKFMSSLPSLPIGTAWFWSPGWLNIFQRVKVRRRHTLDSSSTPKAGEQVVRPEKMAQVNLDELRRKLDETIQQVESNDPKVLKQQIIDLKKQLVDQKSQVEMHQVEVLPTDLMGRLGDLEREVEELLRNVGVLTKYAQQFAPSDGQLNKNRPTEARAADAISARPNTDRAPHSTSKMSPGELKILTAAGQYPSGITKTHLTILTGYKRSSRNTYISRLVNRGLVESAGESITITQAGVRELGDNYDPLPTGRALRDRLLNELPTGEKAILQELIKVYPGGLTRDNISEVTGYLRSSRNTYLSRMTAREIIEVNGQAVVASRVLFEVAVS